MPVSRSERARLRSVLDNRLLAVSYGAGVDSTAMIIALRLAGLRPHIITFADLGTEKPETLDYLARIDDLVASWSWPPILRCRKRTLATTAYTDLYGNCFANETLPSLAFGLKSCSIKWKQGPQDQAIKGVVSGPNATPPHPIWQEASRRGLRIVKLIGYDSGPADLRRSRRLVHSDPDFDYAYPLQLLGWDRADCISAIAHTLGAHMVPIKSACFFCPASKSWESYWLAAHHPELLDRALLLERNALTGRHSRFSAVEFGAHGTNSCAPPTGFPAATRPSAWAAFRLEPMGTRQWRRRRDLCRQSQHRSAGALPDDGGSTPSRWERT